MDDATRQWLLTKLDAIMRNITIHRAHVERIVARADAVLATAKTEPDAEQRAALLAGAIEDLSAELKKSLAPQEDP